MANPNFKTLKKLLNINKKRVSEQSDLIFDLSMDVMSIDRYFATIEQHYHLEKPLQYGYEVSTLGKLSQYIAQTKA